MNTHNHKIALDYHTVQTVWLQAAYAQLVLWRVYSQKINHLASLALLFSQNTSYDLYDENSNIKEITDANGLKTSRDYDTLNRETLRTFDPGVASIASQVETLSTVYDPNNNVTSVTEKYFNNSIADRNYSWQYDNFDRVEFYTDAFGKKLGYQYDNNGNRVQQTEINGAAAETTRYTYDELDRLTDVHYGASNCSTGPTVLCNITSANLNVSYQYDDAFNRIAVKCIPTLMATPLSIKLL